MRDEARCEDGFPSAKVETLVADLEDDFAFHDVEPLLLGEMHMQGRACVGSEVSVLDDEEVAGGV